MISPLNLKSCQNQQRSSKRPVGVELLPWRAYFIKVGRTGMGSLEDKEESAGRVAKVKQRVRD